MLNEITITGFSDEISPDLNRQMEVIKGLGISHIEMRGVDGRNLTTYTCEEAKELRRRLDSQGIRLSAVGSPVGKARIEDAFEPHMELFKHTAELAHIMGTDKIRIFSFFVPEGKDPELFWGQVEERTGRMVEYAAREGLLLLHENEKAIYGDMACRCRKLMDTFYGPHYQCVFDFANFVQCGQDTLEAYELLKPFISYVHIKDALKTDGSVVPAGMGDGHVAKILEMLDQAGYQGYLSLEPHLADFKGFADLEKDGNIDQGRRLTGEEAYTLAYRSLMKVLGRSEG